MIVADSSFIIEGLLKDRLLLDGYTSICSPYYALYEVLNTVWKHQVLLRQIKDSTAILSIFFDLIKGGGIRFINLEEKTIRSAYNLAVKTRTPFYDATFIALARELGLELRTFDKAQAKIFAESQ